ncbi:MAG: hypothetical protein RIQ47_1715 [Bacteroidota bacterium]|jgi:hypothetical protein
MECKRKKVDCQNDRVAEKARKRPERQGIATTENCVEQSY